MLRWIETRLFSLGLHPAGNGLLEGGRNSLLESAQQATLTSVATSAFPRQSNSLARTCRLPHCNRKFTQDRPKDRSYGVQPRASVPRKESRQVGIDPYQA
jgi:hypothetical protein